MSLLIDYAHMQSRALDAKRAGLMVEVHPSVILSMVGNFLECCRVRDNMREDLRLINLETMTNDRDAEKRMKATARGQRDKMTKQYSELVDLLRTTGVLQYDDEWAEQIQKLVEKHKTG